MSLCVPARVKRFGAGQCSSGQGMKYSDLIIPIILYFNIVFTEDIFIEIYIYIYTALKQCERQLGLKCTRRNRLPQKVWWRLIPKKKNSGHVAKFTKSSNTKCNTTVSKFCQGRLIYEPLAIKMGQTPFRRQC